MNRLAPQLSRLSPAPFRLERHRLGPRVYVFGARVHEYQLGVGIAVGGAAVAHALWIWTAVTALVVGVSLVVKDWPDLFPATRDTAEWRWGVHRPPRAERPDRRATAGGARGDDVPVGPYALAGRSQR